MEINEIIEEVKLYQQLRYEQENKKIIDISHLNKEELLSLLDELKKCEVESKDEPNDLKSILLNVKENDNEIDIKNYKSRLKGALVGRFAGCLLGVPVEGYSINYMEQIAKKSNTPFPPIQYWNETDTIDDRLQYGIDKRKDYTLSGINACFVDDDINFTILNLLMLDKYGINYSINDVGNFWIKYLPCACTAEDRALKNLKKGINPLKVADDNPFVEWIGAAIRADAFGYIFPGEPYKAAKCCYNDAYLTHRRNGIYGEMFLAASIAASFNSDSVLLALKTGMKYIPSSSRLYKALSWAMSFENKTFTFKEARQMIDDHFINMHSVHTINNMCVIVFATILAKNDYDKAISYCVAMGLDNDCTAASIGSLYGANLGCEKIDKKWYECFNNTIHTFINNLPSITIDEVVNIAYKIYNSVHNNKYFDNENMQ